MRLPNLPYPGSKTGIAEILVGQMPCAETYMEPFADGGTFYGRWGPSPLGSSRHTKLTT